MKKSLMAFVCCLSVLAMSASYGLERNRTFTSADGSKSFRGYLVDYDSAKNIVSVRAQGGRVNSFNLDKLSESDQNFIKDNADVIAGGRWLKVKLEKYRDSSKTVAVDGARTTTRVEGYHVYTSNIGKEKIEQIEVRTTIFVLRAAENGPSLLQTEVETKEISSLSKERIHRIKSKGIPVVRHITKGQAGC